MFRANVWMPQCTWDAHGSIACGQDAAGILHNDNNDVTKRVTERFQDSSSSTASATTNTTMLPVGSMGCATQGFACAPGGTCKNDVCVNSASGTASNVQIDVTRNPKTYYSHDGTRWRAGLGQQCASTANMQCHRGMACLPGSSGGSPQCTAYIPPDVAGYDCRDSRFMCVPGYACDAKSGACKVQTGENNRPRVSVYSD